MNLLILLCVLCVTFTGLCEGGGVLVDDLLNATVGGKVLFTTKLTPQEPPVTITVVIWKVNQSKILSFSSGSNRPTPEYEDRITLFISSGSLELRNLALKDSGYYSVDLITSDADKSGSTRLMIYEPVSNVMITTSSPDLVEFISSVRLSCSSSGSSLSFLWLNGSSEVTASDRVQFTDGGSKLTIFNVTRYDQGPFRCRVVNPVSNGTSDPVFLFLSYGPGSVQITGPLKQPPSCNAGCIAGIIIACCLIVGLCAGGLYFVSRRRKQRKHLSHGDTRTVSTGSGRQDNVASSSNQDVTYTDINVLKKRDGGTVQLELEKNSEYAEVKVNNRLPAASSTDANVEQTNEAAPQSGANCARTDVSLLICTSQEEGTMNLWFLLCVFCATFTGLCEGFGVLVDDLLNATVGGKVLFTAKLTPKDPPVTIQTVIWNFGILNIVNFNALMNATTPGYVGRITFFTSSGSLELRNLAQSDSGDYNVNILTSDLKNQPGNTKLMIYEPVSNVTITTSSPDLIEFINSFHLSCSSSGSSLSFHWLNGSSEVTASDRVQLTDGGSKLTILNVTRYDQGTYSCLVVNPVSNSTSDPVFLSVSFGPEKTSLNLSPSQLYHEDGSNVSLTCSADSRPPAHFQWIGDKLSVSGPELKLLNIKMNQTGNYSCEASNNKTHRSQTSQPVFISVLRKFESNLVQTANQTDFIEFNTSAVASCSVSSGSSLSFLWMNGSSEVTASDRVQLTDGNSSLTVVNVSRYDPGPFRCRVSNPISNGTSDPVNFTIIYGPDNMALIVNGSLSVGSNLTMHCSAQSNPPAQLSWTFRGDSLNATGPLLELYGVTEDQSGPYSCVAFNNHTNMNSSIGSLVTITKSGSKPQAVNVWLLSLLLSVGFLFSLQDVAVPSVHGRL
ncbi:carcinoembryonic antigen-related cell adhesion molecule 5-like [Limanda limanda]|uniref:carcinoembryonic antigen-related cell adhesion molecule 5-like n=1 Tax=Limanda limanda TaxID=27771 RepID=UPI0029C8B932|nr:carcinoembryonic antigen-related cell adhesion molecule 5-like [Limanda limanda]